MPLVMRPILDANTTLPGLIDFHMEHNSDSAFALYPSPSSTEQASAVSFLEFGRACHRFASIAAGIAQPGEVVGLIANADTLLYVTAMAGFTYAGITVFPISPRNSPTAIVNMLGKVSAHRLMVTSSHLQSLILGLEDELAHAIDGYHLSFEELPGLPIIYPCLAHERPEDPFTPFPRPTCMISPQSAVIYLHSSGSTGFPKPVPYTQEVIASHRYAPLNVGLGGDPREIIFGTMALPSFHAMGVYSQLFYPLFTGRPSAIFTPQYPHLPAVSSPGAALTAMKQTKTNVVFVVPTFFEIWAQDPDAVAILQKLHLAVFAGGPLATGIGHALASTGVNLGSIYGGTEFGIPTCIWPSADRRPEDWPWLAMSDHARPRWIDVGNGQFELQLLTCETHALSVEDLPDVRGYATKDVWMPHPTRPGLWRIVGRADDVIMLANGEKTVPGPMEGVIMSSALVQGAIMFGRERNQVGILLEPAPAHAIDPGDEAALARFRNAVWPKVDEANRDAPAFSRIFKEMILITSQGKPLPRAPKGTVQRKAALLEYEPEIQAIYNAAERSSKDCEILPPSEWKSPDISHWLTQLCSSVRDGRTVDPNVDLFEQGFDSLSVTFLRNRIVSGLRASADSATTHPSSHVHDNIIYANPKITLLASAIHGMVHAGATDAAPSGTQAIADMVAKYSVDMTAVTPALADTSRPAGTVILLTGSTGGLGSQMLAGCLADDKVTRVYAMNRPAAAVSTRARHNATFVDRGLEVGLLNSPKLVFVEGDAGKDWLGLSQELYEEIRASVTVIIHNAWRLDFNLALGSFEPHVRGTRHLLDLAVSTPHAAHMRVLFTSSIAVAQAWPHDRGAVPEEPIDDATWAVGNGYGEGKYVCEQLLVKAAEQGLQTTSFRIGQITGSKPNGAWATSDWLPILVKSSLALGCLPEAQGVASWLPFDTVAQAILDVALAKENPERALNLVHPRPVAWGTLFTAFADALGTGGARLPLVPWAEWQAKLEARAVDASEEDIKDIPAIKLLPFFTAQAAGDAVVRASGSAASEAAALPEMSTAKAQEASAALRELAPLGHEDVERWVAHWRSKGFLPLAQTAAKGSRACLVS